jgi:hypothetical protein
LFEMSDDMFDQGGKIPTVDGETRNFPNWWKKFMAYATMAKITLSKKTESEDMT